MSVSPKFTVSRTTAVASKNRLFLPDRCDVNMKAQRRASKADSRTKLQLAHVADYNTTVGSRDAHHVFLHMMFNEIAAFHKRAYGQVLPRRALELLAEECADKMKLDDRDHYADCLSIFSRLHPYQKGFYETCVKAVEKEMAASESSSNGLSEDLEM